MAARAGPARDAISRARPALPYLGITIRVGSMDASLRNAQRLLAQWVPHARLSDGPGPTLETLPAPAESPRLVPARVVEGGTLRSRRVPGEPVAAFAGFLDGTQASRIVAHDRGVPVVHGMAGAVIRERRNRRLSTWRHDVRTHAALYIPAALAPALWERVAASDVPAVDTSASMGAADEGLSGDGAHPTALAERARHFVQGQRERLERELAEDWCGSEHAPLYIDGGISGSERVARSICSVGVVKRHRTLYVGVDALPMLAGLQVAERTTAFRVAPTTRTAVTSWYLRLRDAAGRDPVWGLVRIEVSETWDGQLSARADEISRWVMAERAPVSLPDPRWGAMAYGVRDCEELLRATM